MNIEGPEGFTLTPERKAELDKVIVDGLQDIVSATTSPDELAATLGAVIHAANALLETAARLGLHPSNIILVTTKDAADIVVVPPEERS